MQLQAVNSSGVEGDREAIVPETGGSAQGVAGVSCPRPDGWDPYTVNPTDSLFRLSILYGVTLEELRSVNCLGEKAVIMPSQVLYVPRMAIATSTPFAASVFPTSIPLRVMNPVPAVQPVREDEDEGQPAPPPSAIPPTAVIDDDPPTEAPPPAATEPPPASSGGGDEDRDDDEDKDKGKDDDDGDEDKDKGKDDDDDEGGGGKDDEDGDKDKGGGKDDDDGDKDKGGDKGKKGKD